MHKEFTIPLIIILILSVASAATPGWSGKNKGLWKGDNEKHLRIVKSMAVFSILLQITLIACLLGPVTVKPALLITLVIGVLMTSAIVVTAYKPSSGMQRGYSYWLQIAVIGLMLVVGGMLVASILKSLKRS